MEGGGVHAMRHQKPICVPLARKLTSPSLVSSHFGRNSETQRKHSVLGIRDEINILSVFEPYKCTIGRLFVRIILVIFLRDAGQGVGCQSSTRSVREGLLIKRRRRLLKTNNRRDIKTNYGNGTSPAAACHFTKARKTDDSAMSESSSKAPTPHRLHFHHLR